MHLDTAAHVKLCHSPVQSPMSVLLSQQTIQYSSVSPYFSTHKMHTALVVPPLHYATGRVSFPSRADLHKHAFCFFRIFLIAANFSSRLLSCCEKKKYVRWLHTILNIAEGSLGGAVCRPLQRGAPYCRVPGPAAIRRYSTSTALPCRPL